MADINEINEAIILCGGKGTRLKEVVNDVPKPLAPIDGIPFLSILMKFLKAQGIERVILATGYMHEKIENLYGNCYEGMEIVYSVEQNPLGTGGAIANALRKIKSENVLVLNGDSVIKFQLNEIKKQFGEIKKQFSEIKFHSLLILKPMERVERYGAVKTFENRVTAFEEKSFKEQCLINTGVYILNKEIFNDKAENEVFSFEKDFLEKEVEKGSLFGMECKGFFIDIGVPEDYAAAQNNLIKQLNQ
ncbi:MAG: nucleotidyltransferase family protein [Bacteroidales bacterium]|nr:nucleotidyltransferase family protein [Bacteroidales bacterium]MEE0962367.1 nucleotidyltransferase family protein [Bacteroidales bacterium]